MADIKQYVNRSNLATFLAKIKELIPSSSSFLTKTEAEETYQEKLKYYEEKEEGGYHDVVIGSSEVRNVGIESGTDFNVSAEGSIDIKSAGGAAVELGGRFATLTNGSADLTIEGINAYFNGTPILTENDVIDDLKSTSTTAPLSANQGKVLNEKFDDILTKGDVSSNTDVAMLSRIFSLPLTSYVGGGLYQASSDVISKYQEMFNSLADDEPVICEYEGVKGLYKYQGSTQSYCFVRVIADLNDLPTGVEDSLTSSSSTIALSANQGKVLDEGKQDKLKFYTEGTEGDSTVTISAGDTIVLDNGDNSLQIDNKVSVTATSDIVMKSGDVTATISKHSGITLDSGDAQLTLSGGVYIGEKQVLTESTGIKSTAIRNVQYVSELPSSPSSDTLYLIPE